MFSESLSKVAIGFANLCFITTRKRNLVDYVAFRQFRNFSFVRCKTNLFSVINNIKFNASFEISLNLSINFQGKGLITTKMCFPRNVCTVVIWTHPALTHFIL